jgi:hypothetical protein
MPAPATRRVLPLKSVRELTDYREAIGAELTAHVYFVPGKMIIVAPVNGTQGLFVEDREVTELPEAVSDDDLGQCICDNLLWNVSDVSQDLRNRKAENWPAYVASGLKTVREFERKAIQVTVQTKNSALVLQAEPRRHPDNSRYVGATTALAASHDEIGAEVRRVVQGVNILSDADYF